MFEVEFEELFSHLPDVYYRVDMGGTLLKISPSVERHLGYDDHQALIGSDIAADFFYRPEDRKVTLGILMSQGKLENCEVLLKRKDGSPIYGEVNARVVFDDSGDPAYIEGIIRNTNERRMRQKRDELRTAQFGVLMESVEHAVILCDENAMPVTFNAPYEGLINELQGMGTSPLLQMHMLFADKRSYEWWDNIYKRVLSGESFNIDFDHLADDGDVRNFEMAFSPISVEDGVRGFCCIVRDVSQRKMTKESIMDWEGLDKSLWDASFEGIVIIEQGKVVQINKAMAEMFGYGPSAVVGKSVQDFVAPESREDVIRKILSNDEEPYESVGLRSNGEKFPMEVHGKMFSYKGRPARVTAVRDLTERKRAEAELKTQRDYILKEMSHRVKNNLNVVSSLLQLQARDVEDGKARRYLQESEQRVRSMSLMHEFLYQSDDLKTIDFSRYVEKLSSKLFRNYIVDSQKVKLSLDIQEDIELDVEIMTSCGLIINELISNALEHGFSQSRDGGEVSVGLRNGDGMCLTVRDNGVGLPGGFDIKNTHSLGMQIVDSLIRQIGGRLVVNVEDGTEFKLLF